MERSCLLYLYSQHKEENKGLFQDIKIYLNRSTSQISMLLKNLEQKQLIERTNTRPQHNIITERGIREIQEHTIEPIITQLKKLQLLPEANTTPSTNSNSNPIKIENNKEIKAKARIPNSQFIQFFLKKVKPKIKEDLQIIEQQVSNHVLENLTENILGTIELSLKILFDMMEKYR
ncbi:MAG: hypothetical protein GF311_27215 [Candidatus Lokiarchaeota archaeon]|nr:hypothetical protein [Candidatus Lokiarchaeota archaeon]